MTRAACEQTRALIEQAEPGQEPEVAWEHVQGCQPCQRWCLADTHDRLEVLLRAPRPPEGLAERVLARFREVCVVCQLPYLEHTGEDIFLCAATFNADQVDRFVALIPELVRERARRDAGWP